MDEPLLGNSADQQDGPEMAAVEDVSTEHVGRWNRLISTTNWEKGRIISEWRCSLMEADAPSQAYSDEAWSRRVGNVSPQHVGRLRRVYERFGEVYDQYPGLYWSHFQAASEWHDAEMWLEGAVENRWSVAQMRTTRWEALGAPADAKPWPQDVVVAEQDEDVDPALDPSYEETLGQLPGVVHALHSDDASERAEALVAALTGQLGPSAQQPAVWTPDQPPENLPPLPPDLAEVYEGFRQAILHHQRSGWQEISRKRVLGMLKALKRLALAPAEP
ncbi:MAG TPA: hypothetical protein VMY37_12860 [Thermoguttaceae bacterium]|nr:hypothetical protein [Thermoguttaceae bacterium]